MTYRDMHTIHEKNIPWIRFGCHIDQLANELSPAFYRHCKRYVNYPTKIGLFFRKLEIFTAFTKFFGKNVMQMCAVEQRENEKKIF